MSKPIFDEQKAREYFHNASSDEIGPGAHLSDCLSLARWAHAEAVKQCEAEIQSLEHEIAAKETEIESFRCDLEDLKRLSDGQSAQYEQTRQKLESERQKNLKLVEFFKEVKNTTGPDEHLVGHFKERAELLLASFKAGE